MRKLFFLFTFCVGVFSAQAQTFTSGLTTTGTGASANTRLGGSSALLANTNLELGTFNFNLNNGKVGIGVASPLSALHIKAGTTTVAPLMFTATLSNLLTTPAVGAMEYNGTSLFFTPTTALQRKTIAYADLSNLSGALLIANGGTGRSALAAGEMLYGSGSTAMSILASPGTAGSYVLTTTGAGAAPAWSAPAAATTTAWGLLGNAGTNSTNNFIGTTDDKDLVFKRFGTKAGILTVNNTSFGLNSLNSNGAGYFNTAIGTYSLFSNTSGTSNVAIGNYALYTAQTPTQNVAVGASSMQNTTFGEGNTALGGTTLQANTTGSYNVALGYSSLINANSNYNVGVGMASLQQTTNGQANVAVGAYSLLQNNIGNYNVGMGYSALNKTKGGSNVGIGAFSLQEHLAGSGNVAMGLYAGSNLTGGDNNIFIGNSVQPNISITASNQLNIGNWIYGNNGNIGIGVAAPLSKLQINILETPATSNIESKKSVVSVSGINTIFDSNRQLGTEAIIPTIGMEGIGGITYFNDGNDLGTGFTSNNKLFSYGFANNNFRSFRITGVENNLGNFSLELKNNSNTLSNPGGYWVNQPGAAVVAAWNRPLNIGSYSNNPVKIFSDGGTPNKVADIFIQSNKVGIGTETPAEKLHVKDGNILTNQNIYASSATSKVLIGNMAGLNTTDYSLAVNGTAIFTKAIVRLTSTWPDYVFEPTYTLPTLAEIEAYLAKNKHLPDVPSAAEVKEKGIDLGDNQTILLKKVEELTLYMIEQDKRIVKLQAEKEELKNMQKQIDELKAMLLKK